MFSNELSYSDIFSLFDKDIIDSIITITATTGIIVITAVPLILLLIMIYSISSLALRENMDEFDKALSNINSIDNIK